MVRLGIVGIESFFRRVSVSFCFCKFTFLIVLFPPDKTGGFIPCCIYPIDKNLHNCAKWLILLNIVDLFLKMCYNVNIL